MNSALSEKFRNLDVKRREKEDILQSINRCESEFTKNNMYVGTIDKEIENIYTNYYETYARSLGEFEDRIRDDMPQET